MKIRTTALALTLASAFSVSLARADIPPACDLFDDRVTCAKADLGKACATGGTCYEVSLRVGAGSRSPANALQVRGLPVAHRRRRVLHDLRSFVRRGRRSLPQGSGLVQRKQSRNRLFSVRRRSWPQRRRATTMRIPTRARSQSPTHHPVCQMRQPARLRLTAMGMYRRFGGFPRFSARGPPVFADPRHPRAPSRSSATTQIPETMTVGSLVDASVRPLEAARRALCPGCSGVCPGSPVFSEEAKPGCPPWRRLSRSSRS